MQVGHQRRPLHQAIEIVLPRKRQLFGIQIARPDGQLAFRKGAGNKINRLRGHPGLLAHLRLGGVHVIQPGQKLRPSGGILLQLLHPAGCQRH